MDTSSIVSCFVIALAVFTAIDARATGTGSQPRNTPASRSVAFAPSRTQLLATIPRELHPQQRRSAGKFQNGWLTRSLAARRLYLSAKDVQVGDLIEMSGGQGVVRSVSSARTNDGLDFHFSVRSLTEPSRLATWTVRDGIVLAGVKPLAR